MPWFIKEKKFWVDVSGEIVPTTDEARSQLQRNNNPVLLIFGVADIEGNLSTIIIVVK